MICVRTGQQGCSLPVLKLQSPWPRVERRPHHSADETTSSGPHRTADMRTHTHRTAWCDFRPLSCQIWQRCDFSRWLHSTAPEHAWGGAGACQALPWPDRQSASCIAYIRCRHMGINRHYRTYHKVCGFGCGIGDRCEQMKPRPQAIFHVPATECNGKEVSSPSQCGSG
jgi:hypothetical protein